jgi:hypothetical protein
VAVGKDTLDDYLAHLEDAFLVRTVAMHSASERQRMVNPRKAYPVDSGLIALFERSGRTHQGRALETALLLELERRGYEVAYLRTTQGFEVDFLAQRPGEPPLLPPHLGARRPLAPGGAVNPPVRSRQRRRRSSPRRAARVMVA